MKRKKTSLINQFATVFLLTVVFIIAVYSILYKMYYDSYMQRLVDINTSLVDQTIENINENNINMQNTLESFAASTIMHNFIEQEDMHEKYVIYSDIRNLFLNYLNLHPKLKEIAIRYDEADYVRTGSMLFNNFTELIQDMDEKEVILYIADNNEVLLGIKKNIYNSNNYKEVIGEAFFILDASYIVSDYENISLEKESEFFVIDSENNIVFSNNKSQIAKKLSDEYVQLLGSEENSMLINDDDAIVISKKIEDLNWSVLSITPKSILFSELLIFNRNFLFVTIVMLFILMVLCVSFYVKISRSLEEFINNIKMIGKGDEGVIINITGNREFEALSSSFNSMMVKINKFKNDALEKERQIYLKEIENKHNQLLMLQAQINPHFLHNTLECINSAGALYGSWEVQEMSVSLAEIFNYSIKGSNIVTLDDEINMVISYLKIQKIRFPEKISLNLFIKDNLRSAKTIKFLLQPIIENSVFHGIETMSKKCSIDIKAELVNNNLKVTILDNGKGMSSNKLETLRQSLKINSSGLDNKNNSIGLANINQRLKLYYKNNKGLQIESTENVGTKVMFEIPIEETGVCDV